MALLALLTWLCLRVFRVQNARLSYRKGDYKFCKFLPASVLGAALMSISPSALADFTSVTKSFTPSTIVAGSTSTITITLTNSPPGNPNSISFTDNYPAGLTNAAVPNLSNTCGGTATAEANGTSLSLTGGSLAGNNSCTVTVSVTACIIQSYTNPSFTVSSSRNSLSSNAATLTVTVGTNSPTTSTVTANPTSVAADGVTASTITVTLKDSCGNPVAGKTVALAAGSGSSTISPPSGPSDANGVVTFTVKNLVVEGPITYTATNTTDGVTITQTAAVTFVRMAAPTVSKSFSPTSIVIGGTSTMTVTLINPNPAPITGTAFTDAYPAGLVNAASPALSNTCGGTATGAAGGNSLSLNGGTIPASGSCSVSIAVTSNTAGTYSNSTGTVTSTNANNGAASIATLTVNPPVSSFNVVETGADPVTGKIFTKITGPDLALDIVALDASNAISTGFTGTVSVEVVDSSSGGACATLPVITTFSNQTFTAGDAGRHPLSAGNAITTAHRNARIRIAYAGPPSIISCSGDNFSIRPQIFTITSTNATQTGTNGTPVIKTGASFNLTAASSVAGYNGTPSIDNSKIIGTPNAGTIGGSFSAASAVSGAATGASFFYSEVGNFGLNANAVFDSAFTSVDTPGTECAAGFSNTLAGGLYGCSIGSTAVAQTTGVSGFGRFIPDNFNVSYNVPVFGAACGSFTYVGQQFNYTTAPVITVTARNGTSNGLTNATTTNYAGAYAKLTNASLAPNAQAARYSRFDALAPPAGNTPALDMSGLPGVAADPAIGAFTNGVSTLTFSSGTGLLFTRGTAAKAPFNADIALAVDVIDTDAVAFAGNPARFGTATAGNGIAFGGGKTMRFGRLKLSNAHGSELLNLPIPIGTEYWNGTAFVPNVQDNCTLISSAANVTFGNYQGGINAGNMASPGNVNLGGAFVSGKGSLTLTKPTPRPTTKGSVDITIDLAVENKTYLRTGPTFSSNPTARATFGIYKRGPIIYLREMY
jgi:hypothetical protein